MLCVLFSSLLYLPRVVVISDDFLRLRWWFSDGDKMENHFKPPYVAPHQSVDPSRIVLQNEVKYTYTEPGK